MIINMYGYIFIRSLFRYFLCLYPVIRCYGTYFSCKINCMFYIQYICWFHPFKKMCTSFKNRMCNGMSSFVRKICFTHKNITESKRLSSAKKSSRGCTFFISHLLIHRRNDNVAWLAAFLKTLFRHNLDITLLEFSIKTNAFVWLLMSYFSYAK